MARSMSPSVLMRKNGSVSFTVLHGEEFLPDFVSGFPMHLLSISLHRPTLEDVFIKLTGRAIRDEPLGPAEQFKKMMTMRRH